MNTYLNCSLDFVGLALVIIIFIFGRLNGKDHHEQRIFDCLLICDVVLHISDALTWYFDSSSSAFGSKMMLLFQFICFFSSIAILFFWVIYCDWRMFEGKGALIRYLIYMVYALVFLCVLIANIFNGMLFYLDAQNVYHRGPIYPVYVCYTASFILYSFILILIIAPKRNILGRSDSYSLLLFSIPPILGVAIQFFFYGVSLMPVSLSLALLLIFVKRLSALITMDNLTGLNNRRVFEKCLEQRISSIDNKELLFLVMMDVNDFKKINDIFGHKTGDEALIRIASILKKACKHGDILARIGGDEFVILGKRKEKEEVVEFCKSIDLLIDSENKKGYGYNISLSIGYEIYQHMTGKQFFQSADQNMYLNKQSMKGK